MPKEKFLNRQNIVMLLSVVPKQNISSDDHRTFKIAVKPKDNVQSIKVMWVLHSRNYKKEGELLLNVELKSEDKKEKVEVDNIDELKENE